VRLLDNLLPARRDDRGARICKGARICERVDRPRRESFHTDWTARGGGMVSVSHDARNPRCRFTAAASRVTILSFPDVEACVPVPSSSLEVRPLAPVLAAAVLGGDARCASAERDRPGNREPRRGGAGRAAPGRHRTIPLGAALLLAILAVAALAREPAPDVVVREAVAAIFEAARTDPQRLPAAIERHVGARLDALRTTRLVMGPHWRRASEAQRARIARSVRRLIVSGLAAALRRNPHARVEIVATRSGSGDDEAVVRTRLQRSGGGPPVSVDYRLRREAGAWMLHDVVIEGVSMITTYRRTFDSKVRRIGLPALIEELEQRS